MKILFNCSNLIARQVSRFLAKIKINKIWNEKVLQCDAWIQTAGQLSHTKRNTNKYFFGDFISTDFQMPWKVA